MNNYDYYSLILDTSESIGEDFKNLSLRQETLRFCKTDLEKYLATESVIETIKNIFGKIIDFITNLFKKIYSFITSLFKRLLGIGRKKAEAIKQQAETAKNSNTPAKPQNTSSTTSSAPKPQAAPKPQPAPNVVKPSAPAPKPQAASNTTKNHNVTEDMGYDVSYISSLILDNCLKGLTEIKELKESVSKIFEASNSLVSNSDILKASATIDRANGSQIDELKQELDGVFGNFKSDIGDSLISEAKSGPEAINKSEIKFIFISLKEQVNNVNKMYEGAADQLYKKLCKDNSKLEQLAKQIENYSKEFEKESKIQVDKARQQAFSVKDDRALRLVANCSLRIVNKSTKLLKFMLSLTADITTWFTYVNSKYTQMKLVGGSVNKGVYEGNLKEQFEKEKKEAYFKYKDKVDKFEF